MPAVRAGNGRFVSASNPLAVINRANVARVRNERDTAVRDTVTAERMARRVTPDRKRNARSKGYFGPLTRNGLAAMAERTSR